MRNFTTKRLNPFKLFFVAVLLTAISLIFSNYFGAMT